MNGILLYPDKQQEMIDLINKILRSISKGKNITTRITLILLTTVISTQDMSNTEPWNIT